MRKNMEPGSATGGDDSQWKPRLSRAPDGGRAPRGAGGTTISPQELDLRKRYLRLDEADEQRLREINDLARQYAEPVIEAFYEHLLSFDETSAFFHDQETLERVKRLQVAYFLRLTQGEYDIAYAGDRLRIGAFHEGIGLAPHFYLGSCSLYLHEVGERLVNAFPDDPERARQAFLSLMKLLFLDIGLAIDTYVFQRERMIAVQQEAIRELPTPTLQVREGLLILPIVGAIEGRRAQQLTQQLLQSIRDRRARVVVLDITGVPSVDSNVANHLVRTVDAARLMGATSILTGLSAEVAETLVRLGLNLEGMTTVGDLQGGLEVAEAMLGYRVVKNGDERP